MRLVDWVANLAVVRPDYLGEQRGVPGTDIPRLEIDKRSKIHHLVEILRPQIHFVLAHVADNMINADYAGIFTGNIDLWERLAKVPSKDMLVMVTVDIDQLGVIVEPNSGFGNKAMIIFDLFRSFHHHRAVLSGVFEGRVDIVDFQSPPLDAITMPADESLKLVAGWSNG